MNPEFNNCKVGLTILLQKFILCFYHYQRHFLLWKHIKFILDSFNQILQIQTNNRIIIWIKQSSLISFTEDLTNF